MLKYLPVYAFLFCSYLVELSSAAVTVYAPNLNKINKVGLPQFINKDSDSSQYFQAIQSLIAPNENMGSGVHIGGGIVLTNRHVYTELASIQAKNTNFHGLEKLELLSNKNIYLVELPTPSSEDSAALAKKPGSMIMIWGLVDKYNDWAVLYDSQLEGQASWGKLRRSTTLKENETLWILGRPQGDARIYIAAGTFEQNKGKVSIINDIDLKGGFSGSPVVDQNGQIVGLVSGFYPFTRQASFVNIEAILKDLQIPKIKNSPSTVVPGAIALNYKFVDNHKKQTVIFLNGNGDSLDNFAQIQSLFPKDYNYLSYDQRGQGNSAYQGTDFKVSTMVKDLSQLLAQLKLSEVHLVGHSFGARIAVAFAAANKQIAKSVVVEDMDFVARTDGGEAQVELLGQKFISLLKSYPSMSEAIEAIRAVYGSDPQVLSEILAKTHYQLGPNQSVTLTATPYQSYLWGSYANAVDLGSALKIYSGPILFLQADPQASAISEAGRRQILAFRPNAKIIPFSGSGHNIHQSMPEKYVLTVLEFLRTTAN